MIVPCCEFRKNVVNGFSYFDTESIGPFNKYLPCALQLTRIDMCALTIWCEMHAAGKPTQIIAWRITHALHYAVDFLVYYKDIWDAQ